MRWKLISPCTDQKARLRGEQHQLSTLQCDDNLGGIHCSTSDVLQDALGRPSVNFHPRGHVHDNHAGSGNLDCTVFVVQITRGEGSRRPHEPRELRRIEFIELGRVDGQDGRSLQSGKEHRRMMSIEEGLSA